MAFIIKYLNLVSEDTEFCTSEKQNNLEAFVRNQLIEDKEWQIKQVDTVSKYWSTFYTFLWKFLFLYMLFFNKLYAKLFAQFFMSVNFLTDDKQVWTNSHRSSKMGDWKFKQNL